MSFKSIFHRLSILIVAILIWGQSYGQCTPPSVTSNPSSSTVCAGLNTSFTVGATGTNINYQWQINTGSGFVDLSNSSVYSGATDATLVITGATTGLTGYLYRCVVRGDCTPAATSNSATLTVNASPTVSANPPNRTICAGANTTFTVTATGTGVTYQWQVNTGSGYSNISNTGVYTGATTATLTITGATTTMDAYLYRCVVSISTCSVQSTAGTLTVNGLPAITTHPSNATICNGSNTTLTVAATGAGLTYQWQLNSGSGFSNLSNGGIYSGATTASLAITGGTTAINTYQYRCIISGTCTPAVTSNAATITVNTLPAITANPSNRTACEGTNTTFTVTGTGTTLDYQWQVNTGSGFTDLTNNAPYTGVTTATLTITNTQLSQNGYLYRCIVRGACTPSATSNSASLTINASPSISAHPANQAICNGTNTSFSVTTSGATSYQWQVDQGSGFTNISNGGVYSNATTATLNITGATGAISGYNYRCIVSNTNCSVQSNSASLSVGASPNIAAQASNRVICEGANTTFAVNATNATTYQWQADQGSGFADITNGGVYSNATTATLTITGATAAMSSYQYRCVVSNSCTSTNSTAASLTVHTTPSISGQPGNSTICTGNNTSFAVTTSGTGLTYQWQVNTGSGYTDVANNSAYSGATAATLNITAATGSMTGYLYRCNITNVCASLTSNIVTLTVNSNPSVTTQPSARTICENSNTTFIVAATGGALTYQWQVDQGSGFGNIANGGVYSNATTATLAITSATAAMNSYQYRCVVTNNCTSTNTNAVSLTVHATPSITVQPANTTACTGGNTSIAITMAGTGLAYQWQVNSGSGYVDVVNNSVYSGATAATLNITGATGSMNSYLYRCNITNVCATLTSNAATLTVNTTAAVTGNPVNRTICANSNTTFTVVASGGGLAYQWQVDQGSGFGNITNGGVYSNATTATLTITSATAAMSSYQYRCVVTNNCATVNSTAASLTVHTTPAVTVQPANSTICTGNNTSFAVTASGTGLTYQWQVNTGSGFIDLSNNSIYSGATAATLNITAATGSMTGYLYRCNITNVCATLTSNAATLTVNTTAAVTGNPVNRTICANSNTTFVVTASGTNLTYQWQVDQGSGFGNITNGGVYSNATTATLTITGATAAMSSYQYRCVVSNSCISANSTAASLTVHTTPSVTGQPANSAICTNGNTSFTITTSGTNLNYQWQVNTGSGYSNISNNATYSGATTATLSITGATALMNNYLYRCDITNVCATATSNSATLTINSAPAITTQPVNTGACNNSNVAFTVATTGAGLTYQWQEDNGGGFVNITNGGMYSNATTATLNLTGVTLAMTTYKYRCNISGTCTPPVTSNIATLTVSPAAVITADPVNRILCRNQNTTFAVTATGTSLSYQWQVNTGSGFTNLTNTTPYTGVTTATLTITSAQLAINGYLYRCVVSSSCGTPQNSASASITVNDLPAITTQPVLVASVCAGSTTGYSVVATGTGITYQWQERPGSTGTFVNITNGGVYSGATTANLTLTGVTASMTTYTYRCIVSGTCTPAVTSTARAMTVHVAPSVTTHPSNASLCAYTATSFSVVASGTGLTYRWQSNPGTGTWTNLSNGTANTYAGTTTATLAITTPTPAINNYQYRCVITNACTSINSNAATLSLSSTPTITTHPPTRTLCAGVSTTFNTVATGATSYQWQEDAGSGFTNLSNTGIYSGVTTNILNISPVNAGMNTYKYRCVIGNGTCSANTNAGTLNVTTAPAVTTQPIDRSICQGTNTTFAVVASGTSLTYRWQVNTGTGYTNLANGAPYSGTTTATLTVTNPALTLSGYRYRCVVTNVCTSDTSLSGLLTINPLAVISTQPANFNACIGANTSVAVVASGATTYQWQVDIGPGGFVDVTNSAVYSGATSATLNISGVTSAMNAYQFRCNIDAGLCPLTTSVATMTTVTAAAITVNPVSQPPMCSGVNTSFSVTATGTTPAYQWQVDNGSGFANISNGGIYSGATSNVLSLTNVPASVSGYLYRCVVSNFCTTLNSTAASIDVDASPSFTAHPANTAVCNNDNGSFSVTTLGTGLNYQWQVDQGSGFSNITNGGVYSNATTGTLNITGATTAMNGYQYRCVIDNNCGTLNSNGATLTIYTPAAITADPSVQSICEGNNTTYMVTATGSVLTYQWQVDQGSGFANVTNTAPYSGATTATLTVSNAPVSITGYQYRCIVSNPCATANSAAAGITVHANGAITAQPANTAICDNNDATFSITTTGTGLTYQWQVDQGSGFANVSNTAPYSGATTTTLNITGATVAMSGYQYRCVTNNNCGTLTSNAATLTIHTPAAITADPSIQSICEGNNTAYSVTATGSALTYQWQVDQGSGFANVSNTAPYSGATTATLTISNAPASITGYQYRCIVSNPCATVNSAPAAITVHANGVITTQPANTAICNNNNTSFSIATTGTGLTYQWQVDQGSGFNNVANGGVYSNATTTTLNITGATTSMNGYQYRCVINNNCGPVTSNAATLTINAPVIITADPIAQSICEGNNTTYSVTATGSVLTYQWQVDQGSGFANISNTAPYSGVTTATLTVSNAPASITGYQYRCVVSNPCTSISSAAATITVQSNIAINTQPANTGICNNGNASFSVATSGTGLTYQWQVDQGSGFGNITNSGVYSNATTATLNITAATIAMNGYQYRCVINNICATLPSGAATLTIHTALAITVEPTPQTICEGSNTSFSVTNTGTGGSYQWQVNTGSGFTNITNAAPYAGATTATLNVSNAAASLTNNQYRCIITNTCGTATSAAVVITVNTLPSVTTQPVNSAICIGNNSSFSVSTAGTGIAYQWQVNTGSGFTNITNNATYSGATTASLAVNSPAVSMDGYLYRCVVTNICYSVVSNSATLNVNTPPAITTSPVSQVVCETYNTTISVVATGSGLTYQWQVNTGSGFTNLSNTGIYTGAATANLSLTNIPASITGYQYRCVISGTCTPSITTSAATITVNYLPVVTNNPSSITLCSGGNTSFSAAATGTNISYQWEINTGSGFVDLQNVAPYSNVTTTTLTITGVTTSLNGYQYRCVVRGTCTPAATTSAATLTVNQMPTVTSQPSNKVICDGSNTTFAVATSNTLNYQWQVNTGSGFTNITASGVYSGVNTSTLTITGAPLSAAGQYRCVIDNVSCTNQSNAATLTVNPLPSITTHPASKSVCAGDATTLTIVAPGALIYIWQINTGSGFTNLTNTGIYSGVSTATLNISNVSASMSGYQYRCLIDNTVCTAQSNAATISVNSVPTVTAHPTNKVICLSDATTFSITGTGTGINYQWEVNNGSGWVDLSNTPVYSNVTTNTLNITGALAAMNGYQYRCVVRGTCTPPATSNAATLTVNMPPAVTSSPTNKTICEGNTTTFAVTATGTALTYQWSVNTGSGYTAIANGTNYSGATTATLSVISAPATFNNYRYRCVVSGTCNPPATSGEGILTVNTSPVITTQPLATETCKGQTASFTTAATGTSLTYQWQVNAGSGFTNLSDNAIYSGSTTTSLLLTNTPLSFNGYKYRCVVTGICPPTATSIMANLTVYDSTYLIDQTNSDTVCEGTTQIFSVTTAGRIPDFQWQVNTGNGIFVNLNNNTVYAGVHTNTLSILNTPDSEDGKIFRCVLVGRCNNILSQEMKLSVNMVPTITTHPVDAYVKDNDNATFSVTSKDDNVNYRWQSAANENDYVYINDNGNFSGTRTNVLMVKKSSIAQSGYRFRCIIEESTDCGFAPDTSNFAVLAVQNTSGVRNLSEDDDYQVTLYPNPVRTSQVFVRFSKAPVATQLNIRIVDKLGRTIATDKAQINGSGELSVNIDNLVPGVYMLMLGDEQNKTAKTLRFTKE